MKDSHSCLNSLSIFEGGALEVREQLTRVKSGRESVSSIEGSSDFFNFGLPRFAGVFLGVADRSFGVFVSLIDLFSTETFYFTTEDSRTSALSMCLTSADVITLGDFSRLEGLG